MPNRLARRPVALVAWCCAAAIGAATAIGAAVTGTYAVCAAGLFTLGGGALAAYRTVRATENRTDHAVLERLQRSPGLTPEGIAADLGLRPATVRLSLHRLAATHRLPPTAHPDSGR
ncbi:hypothetical protein [Streptomyces sp. CBMA123]|uniref:hypothetical protein n=1 Tax=Streptomyces sp. CBMA123 TaxID=1896313 RepID=UPI001661FE8B|nr:hypothetical protein [Streptomyces sp. CBMA123]MBD0692448.1 hypothetical protein [Streptomyces sp. CBMA123]